MSKKRNAKPLMLITGSSGLLGTALAREFAGDYRVIGLDVKEPEASIRGVSWMACDLTKDEDVKKVLADIREQYGDRVASVIHLAAFYDFSGGSNPMYKKLTVEGTRRLIRGLQDFTVEQFIYSSSLLVMKPADAQKERTALTEDAPTRAEWEYPASKLEAEAVLKKERAAIPVVVLRLAGVYTDQCRSLPIGDHIRRIYEKELESYFFPGDKEHGQPFIHISDAVECVRKAVEKRKDLESWEVFLIAEPITLSYDELQEVIGQLIHDQAWPTLRVPKAVAKAGAWVKDKLPWEDPFIKPWMVDLADDDYSSEIERARERLEWEPTHRLNDALRRIIRFLKDDPEQFYELNNLNPPDKKKDAASRGA